MFARAENLEFSKEIQKELNVPDPNITKAMEILDEEPKKKNKKRRKSRTDTDNTERGEESLS